MLCVYLIILSVSTDKSDISYFVGVVELHHEPVLIACNIKDNPVPPDNAGATELSFQIIRTTPLSIFDSPIPGS